MLIGVNRSGVRGVVDCELTFISIRSVGVELVDDSGLGPVHIGSTSRHRDSTFKRDGFVIFPSLLNEERVLEDQNHLP